MKEKEMTHHDRLYAQCVQEAINAGALEPQGFGESVSANLLSYYEGRSFATTPHAQGRLEQWTNDLYARRLREMGQ
jgi:hypothetical protein